MSKWGNSSEKGRSERRNKILPIGRSESVLSSYKVLNLLAILLVTCSGNKIRLIYMVSS